MGNLNFLELPRILFSVQQHICVSSLISQSNQKVFSDHHVPVSYWYYVPITILYAWGLSIEQKLTKSSDLSIFLSDICSFPIV